MHSSRHILYNISICDVHFFKPIFNHFGIFFCPSFDTVEDEAEAEDVWRSEVDETLYCGGAGRSIALERIDDTSGAVTLDALSALSSNLKRSTEDGARCNSARVRSLTFGSETFKSRFGGV